MTEFIGARISLISKSNIRYVGILHEINSETSTVALEQVTSHGTEGRRGGEGEIAGSENVYEYIVFRGSDVKDLRIEEPAQKKPQMPPPQLDDPAILGQSSTRPYAQPPAPFQQQPPPPIGVPPYYYPHPQQQRGFGSSAYQSVGAFGAYPPPPNGQPPMAMPAPGMPPQPQMQQQSSQQPQPSQPAPLPPQQQQPQKMPQQQQPQQPPPTGPQNRAPPQAPIGPSVNHQAPGPVGRQAQGIAPPAQTQKPQAQPSINGQVPVQQQQQMSDSPSAQPRPAEQSNAAAAGPVSRTPAKAPTGPKARGGIIPALPLTSPARTVSVPATASPNDVAIPPVPTLKNDAASAAVRDLADKVNRLAMNAGSAAKTNANASTHNPAESAQSPLQPQQAIVPGATMNQQPRSRQPGTGGFVASRSRNGYRGSFNSQNHKVEVPATDYDFQYNNDKFNKQDLVKEAIASGTEENAPHPTETTTSVVNANAANGDGAADVVIPPVPKDGFYDRKSSFFDNISCENKERAEAVPGERRGGAQFRSEEQKKNLETFGQGSVDGGYSGGYMGGWRGRGRGRGYRGRGGFSHSYSTGRNGRYRPQQQVQTGTAGN